MDKEIKNLNNKYIKAENNEVNLDDELKDEHNEDRIYDIHIENEDNKLKNFELLKQNNGTTNNKESKFILNRKNIIIITSMISIIVLFGIYIGKTASKYNNKIFPGASIYNIDVSNLNKSEFLNKVTEIEDAIQNNKMIISINNKKYSISYKNLISNYNNEKLYDDIMNSQNKKNIFSKFMSIILKEKKAYNLYADIDNNQFNKLKDEIKQEVNRGTTEPKVIINGEVITYEKGKEGYILDEDALYNDIKEYIIEKNLIKENIDVQAKLIKDDPNISMDDLKKINSKISTYTTTYGSGNSRGSNIENAANKIDDLLLMPGDEFSYEKTVGPVTSYNGYKYAPVISNGKLVDGIGGGVCQVSSTLYNTQLKAGILPTERRNHSKAVSYVPRGLDATLASGIIDYKFKNTYNYPLVINTSAKNGKLTIEIWSNENALNGLEYTPVSYNSGKVSNTYLYGYDRNGNKVYEKHIDTSVYR